MRAQHWRDSCASCEYSEPFTAYTVCAPPQYAEQTQIPCYEQAVTPKAEVHTKKAAAAAHRSSLPTPLRGAARRNTTRGVNKHT